MATHKGGLMRVFAAGDGWGSALAYRFLEGRLRGLAQSAAVSVSKCAATDPFQRASR